MRYQKEWYIVENVVRKSALSRITILWRICSQRRSRMPSAVKKVMEII